MPIKKAYFKNTKIKYVLAGHFHTNFDIIDLPNGGYFVYPGSPVSITSKELGKRKVNLFEVGEAPKELPLDTFHYEFLDIHIDPFIDKNPLEYIEEKFNEYLNRSDTNYKLMIKIDGYIDSSKYGVTEEDIDTHIRSLREQYPGVIYEVRNEIRDLSFVLNNEIFKEFTKRLANKDYDEEEKRGITEYVIKAMMEVLR